MSDAREEGQPSEGPPRGVDPRILAEADTASPIPGGAMPRGWGSYDHLRHLFDQAPVAMSLIDLATRTSYPNHAYLRLFGYDQPGAPPFDATHITHPDDREASDEAFRRLARGEVASVEADKRYVRADGSTFVGHLRSTLVRNDAGETWALLSVVHDISERHRAEQLLSASEHRLRTLVESITDALVVLDAEGTITYASPSAAQLLGYPAGSRLGTNVFDVVHPEDRDEVARAFLANVSTPGSAEPLRFRLRHADGSIRHVEAVGSNLLHDPAVAGLVVLVRDLTDREEVATALERSEARFRRMLENISDTVTLVGPDGHIIATTGNVKEIAGYPVEFWTARNGFELVHPDDVPQVERMLAELLANPGAEVTGEFRTRTADGEAIDVEGSAVNLLDDPTVGAIVITTRNITPRKQVERELAEARDAAVRQLEIRNEFIASVSHELRTPIHGILGLTELLATAELDDQPLALARAISRATESLRMVLDDLLDFTKIEAGRLELVDELVDVRELVDEILTLFGPQASAKGIELGQEVEEVLPERIRTDGFRVRQVLSNLVSNAVKFTAEGSVVVRASVDPGTADRDAVVVLAVSDTGPGVAPDVIDRLFEPFSQAFASTAREYGGTGLGLAIARRLSELLGGSLDVRSALGVGSTFEVRLPLVAADDLGEPPPPAHVRRPAASGDRERVLVVEDNPVNQLLIRHQLERLGCEPVVVAEGPEALERFELDPPAAVLMDCQMPGMDGFETTRRLRSLERRLGRPRTPVVALTANALPGERSRCLEAGMDDFLAKPVGLGPLGDALAAWLPSAALSLAPGAASAAGADAVPVAGELPLLDHRSLEAKVDELASPAIVAGVVRAYLRELAGRLEALQEAADTGAVEALVAVAHRLRGASAAVGAERIAALCAGLEERPHAPDVQEVVDAVVAEAPALSRALLAWVGAIDDRGAVPGTPPGAGRRLAEH